VSSVSVAVPADADADWSYRTENGLRQGRTD